MGISLLAEHITCVAPTPKKKKNQTESLKPKVILDNVTVAVPAGQVFACMGPSGSGKTTLLNILAGQARPPIRDSGSQTPESLLPGRTMQIKGEIYFNGTKMTSQEASQNSRYVMQKDRLFEFLTVWETLYFAARLKLKGVDTKEVKARCESILDELGLLNCRNVLVGGPIKKGISGGELKRLSCAIALIDNPQLLFLDEPTSGLDSSLAFDVVKVLKNLARKGRTIVMTIHQPRSQIYQMFDSLLLLSEGKVAYQGPATESSAFTKSIGYPCPVNFNTADFLLDLLTTGKDKSELSEDLIRRGSKMSRQGSRVTLKSSSRIPQSTERRESGAAYQALAVAPPNVEDTDDGRIFISQEELDKIPGQFQQSPWAEKVTETVNEIKGSQGDIPLPPAQSMMSAMSHYWYGVFLLMGRHFKNKGRNPMQTVLKVTVTIVMSLINGALYFDLQKPQHAYDCKNFFNYLGAVAFITLNLSFGSIASVTTFPAMRAQLNREMAGKMYSPSAFFLAYNLADTLFLALDPLALIIIVYWMIGFGDGSPGTFFFFLLSAFVTCVAAVGWCLLAATLAPNEAVVGALAPVGTVFAALTSGFWITQDDLPAFWWIVSFVSWVRWGLNSLMQCLFRDLGVIENCFGVTSTAGKWSYLLYGLAVALAFRVFGYLGLKYTNTRVGMEG